MRVEERERECRKRVVCNAARSVWKAKGVKRKRRWVKKTGDRRGGKIRWGRVLR